MRVVLAGKFECSIVRSIDAILQPERNASTHPYYVGINRYVSKSYFDRAATFLALADATVVPTIDWNYPIDKRYRGVLADTELGIERDGSDAREWDDDTRKFVRVLLRRRALSAASRAHISMLALSHYDPERRAEIEARLGQLSESVAEHYLCRLFLQLNVACQSGAFLVLGEEDIRILNEIGAHLKRTKLAAPFEFPDLSGKLIDPDRFCDGLLNFNAPDIQSVGAVRAEPEIRRYGLKVSSLLKEAPSSEREHEFLAAMIDAHERSVAGAKAEQIFEIISWVAKPLHYVPGVDVTLTALEDAKDLGMKWLQREVADKEWYLVGARMQDVAIRDYLARKSNV
jgi:hypothetical protein